MPDFVISILNSQSKPKIVINVNKVQNEIVLLVLKIAVCFWWQFFSDVCNASEER